MARTESRSSQERESQTREEVYTFEEEDALAIPEEVKERFLNQGMDVLTTYNLFRKNLKGVEEYIPSIWTIFSKNVGGTQR